MHTNKYLAISANLHVLQSFHSSRLHIEAVDGQTLKLEDWLDSYIHTYTCLDRQFRSCLGFKDAELACMLPIPLTYIHTYIILWRRIRGDSRPRVAQRGPERDLSVPLWASPGLSGPLWASLQPTNQPASQPSA